MLSAVEWLQLGLEHQQNGRLEEAERIYRQVLARNPDHPDALHLLGVLAAQRGRAEAAAALIARAIALNPAAAFYHNNLGNVLQDMGRLTESLLCYEEALRLEPEYVEALVNLGNALNKLDRFGEALSCYLEAQRLRPDYAGLYVNLAHALIDQGLLEEAQGLVEEALRLEPDNAQAHGARSRIWLLKGDFERGLAEYEWRWVLQPGSRRPFAQPEWDGSSLQGRRILLHAEQGLGDTIQFLRYVPLVQQAGGRVIVECPPRLVELAAGVEGVEQVVASGQPLPEFDLHAPLLSLPRILGTRLETIPARVPYLRPPAAEDFPELPGGKLRVGLAWAGNPAHRNDRRRSVPLERLEPLGSVEGVVFFNLQKGPAAEQGSPAGLRLEQLPGRWNDLPWLAASVARLDLVISVDTLQAHLAGALGRPVWLLLPFAPDWRWMLGRDDSPWYPTMRLFRQPAPGDWDSVIERVRQELVGKVEGLGREPGG